MLEISAAEPYVHRIDGVPDERRQKRIAIHNLGVRNPVPGIVVDLNENGLGIECSEPLRVAERYPFTLIVGRSGRYRKWGEVRWSRLTVAGIGPDGKPEFVYRVGISFLN